MRNPRPCSCKVWYPRRVTQLKRPLRAMPQHTLVSSGLLLNHELATVPLIESARRAVMGIVVRWSVGVPSSHSSGYRNRR